MAEGKSQKPAECGQEGEEYAKGAGREKAGEEAVKEYNKGDMVKAKVLDIDIEKERISLGIKQLTEDPFKSAATNLKKGDVVEILKSQKIQQLKRLKYFNTKIEKIICLRNRCYGGMGWACCYMWCS